MYIKDIYEIVVEAAPCSQPKFLIYLDTTARSLIAKYGKKRVVEDGAYTNPLNINSDIAIREEYRNAIVSNILYLVTGNPDYKTDYVAEAEYAFKTAWKADMKGVKMVGEDWYRV